MDDYLLNAIARWTANHFGDDSADVYVAMVAQFETDPEFYENVSLWRCHDDMIRDGRCSL